MAKTNRKYKDRLFRLIFADEKNKKNTLSLYNMLNNSSYENEEDLEITTLEDVLYINMKNDLSFIIADIMNPYEQQSTHNPNMPLRGFLYFASLYENHVFRTGHQQSGGGLHFRKYPCRLSPGPSNGGVTSVFS